MVYCLSQIFDQAYNVKGYNGDYSIVDSMPFSIGVSVLIVIVTILIIICRNRLDDRYKRILRALGVVFGVSVILTMNVFPYNYFMVKCKPIYDLLRRMEYPWRFLTLATIFATCLFMLSASMINLYYGRKVLLCFMAVILLVTIMQSKQMEDRIVHEKYGVAHYNGNDICWTFTELVPDGATVFLAERNPIRMISEFILINALFMAIVILTDKIRIILFRICRLSKQCLIIDDVSATICT